MRVIAIIIAILGLAGLVFGILLVTQAASGEQEVADSIAPLPLDQLDAQYDTVTAQYNQMKAAGTQPNAQYNYLYANKVGLGLARANVGTASLARTSGVVDILMGLGLLLAGIAMLRKAQSAA
jgi:phosphotransferase system  glucose/maltose/N-acetylglucosamine-specific IIC component